MLRKVSSFSVSSYCVLLLSSFTFIAFCFSSFTIFFPSFFGGKVLMLLQQQRFCCSLG